MHARARRRASSGTPPAAPRASARTALSVGCAAAVAELSSCSSSRRSVSSSSSTAAMSSLSVCMPSSSRRRSRSRPQTWSLGLRTSRMARAREGLTRWVNWSGHWRASWTCCCPWPGCGRWLRCMAGQEACGGWLERRTKRVAVRLLRAERLPPQLPNLRAVLASCWGWESGQNLGLKHAKASLLKLCQS